MSPETLQIIMILKLNKSLWPNEKIVQEIMDKLSEEDVVVMVTTTPRLMHNLNSLRQPTNIKSPIIKLLYFYLL